ncbi:MAG: FecR family protein, partial [Terriglobales bacterium]
MTDTSYSIHESAVLWYERLHRDRVADTTRMEFEAWVKSSPAHQAAYKRVESAGQRLQAASETPAALVLRHEAALRLTRSTSKRLRPFRALAAVAAVAAVATTILVISGPASISGPLSAWFHGLLPGETRYATGTGERLATTLKDGTQVTLDTQSELEVAFNKSERLVRLRRGQGFFEVAKDKVHPFVVEANNRRLVAVGTAFDVRLDESQIRVTMVEGTVRVEPLRDSPGTPDVASGTTPGGARTRVSKVIMEKRGADAASGSAQPQTLISAGEQLWVDGKAEDHVKAADPDRATSWRRGQLIFDAVRLGDAIEEVNRYS